ncbi:LLM class flavin-dependent oxidoreductase [Nakamurella flava]|uniref:LLM class flavin-dependent oxidoreductase n=1 Tax=Nakamurella flava TaxID=2576308 RepID=A0A4U6QK26_9ACTN|nr:LLM class flavin-dependent oxidoreductase [Nakamurella flava]TKV60847.1 LLM class flavin-dependent oxidoreductase [Nakamurella flava]
MTTTPLLIGVALDGAGWHPAAWREPTAHPAALFASRTWVELARTADTGGLDFLTLEDVFAPAADGSAPVRLDATLLAARLAPVTTAIGLLPSVAAQQTEPFHAAKAIATLDYAATGRAGVLVRASTSPAEYAHLGRRTGPAPAAERYGEVADYVEVLRRLWDSWEDDAEIRDAATGRFVDIDKLHYIDFAGPHFSVKGPSITPRPPQGQPPVAVTVDASALTDPTALRAAVRGADLVLAPAADVGEFGVAADRIRASAPTPDQGPAIVAEIAVALDRPGDPADRRLARLDGRQSWSSPTAVVGGSADAVADTIGRWQAAGADGVRLRPAVLPDDLHAITDDLLPALRARGLTRPAENAAATFRDRLGLARPENRYATSGVSA